MLHTGLLAAGLIMVIYGLAHILFPLPAKVDLPFPFEHVYGVKRINGELAYQTSSSYYNSISADPYWLVWSIIFYSGTIMTFILSIKISKQKHFQ
jgi:hypothetical protein